MSGDVVTEMERVASGIGVYKDIAALLLDAAAELRELRVWKDGAIANCAKRECSLRDRRLRDAEADIARLDWLQERRAVVGTFPEGHSRQGIWSAQCGILEVGTGATLREAIDAAMKPISS